MAAWHQRLRTAREGAALDRAQLAARSGISEWTIRSYETGRRRPSRDHLIRLLDELRIDRKSRHLIVAEAGFAPEDPGLEQREQRRTQREAVKLVLQRPWPAFLINEHLTVLAMNDVGMRLVNTSRAALRAADVNLLTVATQQGAQLRLLNWEESVMRTISRIKASGARLLNEPDAYLALQRITGGDPQLVARLAELWESTPPDLTRHTSWAYEAAWKTPGGDVISFHCTAHTVSARDQLEIHDWFPADSESHRLIEQTAKKRRRGGRSQPTAS